MKIQKLTILDSIAQRRYIECVKNGIQFYYDKENLCLAYLYSRSMIDKTLTLGDNSEYYSIVESYDMMGDIKNVYLVPISIRQFTTWVDFVKSILPEIVKK